MYIEEKVTGLIAAVSNLTSVVKDFFAEHQKLNAKVAKLESQLEEMKCFIKELTITVDVRMGTTTTVQ